MRKLYALFGLLVIASMVLAACGPKTPGVVATEAPPAGAGLKSKDPTTFVQVTFGEPETLDPALAYETAGGEQIQNIYESLVFYNKEKASDFVPQLATDWTISEDGKTYVFNIRPGVKFHNGDEMTAEDFAYSFQRGMLQGGTSSPQWMYYEAFFGTGVDDIAVLVADKISTVVEAKVDELVGAVDLTKFDAAAFETLFTEYAAFYTKTSGYAVDAVATLATDENKAAVEKLLTDLEAATDDTAKVDLIKTAVTDLLSSADGGDPYALYDDNATMQLVDPAIIKEVGETVLGTVVADNAAGTLTFNLAQAWGPMLATIANTWGSVMDKKWVAENGGWDGSPETWAPFYAMLSENDPFTEITNGTGPFMLDHWTKGEEIVLVRNDNYWRTEPAWEGGPSGPAKLARVITKSVDEWGTRFAMLQAGDADIVVVPPENRSQTDAMVGEKCVYNPATDDYDPCEVTDDTQPLRLRIGKPGITRTDIFLNFNIANPDGSNPYIGSGALDGNGIPVDFFSDIHVRKAFNYCFDWDTYIADVFKGEAMQSMAIPIPGMPGYSADAPHYTYDTAKCEEEFKASTWTSADGASLWDTGFRFQAVYNQGNTTRQTVAEILATSINALNEKFVIETVGLPWPAFLRAQRAKILPFFVSGWLEDIHDPHNWYVPYLVGTYGLRQSLPEEMAAKYRDLINQGVSVVDPAARDAIYQQLNQAVYDDAPDVLLAIATSHGYTQRWLQGVITNSIYPGFYFYPMWKD